MTTEQLRKVIKVTHWMIGEKGLSISYDREDLKPIRRHLILNPVTAALELDRIGAIDGYINDIVFSVSFDGHDMNWATFISCFKMCQWEALSIVIRHEHETELEKDLGIINIENAINKIIT